MAYGLNDLTQAVNAPLYRIDSLNQEAEQAARGDLSRAWECASEALQLARLANYQQGIAAALYILAGVYYYRSAYDKAFESLDKALSIYRALADEAKVVQSMTLLGVIYRDMGDYAEALETHQTQLDALDRNENKQLRARVLNSMAGIYTMLKNYQETITCLERSYVLMGELDKPLEEAVILGNLCQAFSLSGRHDQALAAGEHALALLTTQPPAPMWMIQIRQSYGHACLRIGDYDCAEGHIREALRVARDLGNVQAEVAGLSALCELELAREQTQPAVEAIAQALTRIPAGVEKTYHETYELAARVYRKAGDLERAYDYLERSHTLKALLFSESNEQRMRFAQAKHATTTARQEAALYQQRNRELETQRVQDHEYFERLNELKDELLNTASHNLKNPLSTISMATYVLGQLPEVNSLKAKRALNSITHQVDIMTQLVSEVLELAKLETGRAIVKRETGLSSLLGDCVVNLALLASQKELTLTLEPIPEKMALSCDAGRLSQAMQNLISNAIKYTQRGGVVTVSATYDGQGVAIRVADTGVGIPPYALPHLFERFYRVKEHHALSEGTGLGLSIVQTIIAQHGGRIDVQSEVGKGSTFTVHLPIEQPGENPVETQTMIQTDSYLESPPTPPTPATGD